MAIRESVRPSAKGVAKNFRRQVPRPSAFRTMSTSNDRIGIACSSPGEAAAVLMIDGNPATTTARKAQRRESEAIRGNKSIDLDCISECIDHQQDRPHQSLKL